MLSQKTTLKPNHNHQAILLAKWYDGDVGAFKELYNQYYGMAIAFCLKCCGDRELSKDITQETFISLYKKVSSNKGEKIQDFKKYLFGALMRNYLNHSRKLGNQEIRLDHAKIIPLMDASEDDEIRRYMNDEVMEYALSCLNDGQKEVYKQQLGGYQVNEIAAMNEMTEGQVRGLLFRARKVLKKNKDFIRNSVFGW